MSDLQAQMLELLEEPVQSLVPNKQLYPNSKLNGSETESALLSSPLALNGTRLPNFAIIHEKPEHRLIVYLKAQGLTNREVARKSDYTEAWISQVTRQPWFQLRLLELVRESGGETVKEFLGAQLEPSILRLVHLRDHAESESVQLGATVNLLDRFLGKPVQRTEAKLDVTHRESRVENIDEEMKMLEAEEQAIRTKLGERVEGVMTAPTVAPPASPAPGVSRSELSPSILIEKTASSEAACELAIQP